MNAEAWTILTVGVALGGLVWQMLRLLRQDMAQQFELIGRRFIQVSRQFEEIHRKFEEISETVRELGKQIDRLGKGHHGVARELSELRGEIRGRLDERGSLAPTPA